MSAANVINSMIDSKEIAFAGLSRNSKSFSRMILKEMKKNGFNVFPINPNAENIDDIKTFKSVSDEEIRTKNLLIMTPKEQTDELFKSAIEAGYENIWIQQGSETKESENIAKELNFTNLVTKQCFFMFNNPKGIHKFHRFIMDLFKLTPS